MGRSDNVFRPKRMDSIYEKIDFTIQRQKSKDMYITRTALIHLVRSKHATYLEFPPLGFEPRFRPWPFTKEKLVFPGKHLTVSILILKFLLG